MDFFFKSTPWNTSKNTPQFTSQTTQGSSSRSSTSRTRTPSDRTTPSSSSFEQSDALLVEEILSARSYYDVLGLTGSAKRNFEESQLRRLYLQRSRVVHPDRHQNSARSTAAFQRLAEAYETLRDPRKRRRYELVGERGSSGIAEETFSVALGQLLEEFIEGNFEQILSVVGALRIKR